MREFALRPMGDFLLVLDHKAELGYIPKLFRVYCNGTGYFL